jgi:hypothetical protein
MLLRMTYSITYTLSTTGLAGSIGSIPDRESKVAFFTTVPG